MNEATFVFGAGLAGGFAYWAIAGWSAGFWKPVFGDGRVALPRARRAIRSIRPREQEPDGERAHQSGEQVVDRAHGARRAADRGGEAVGEQDQQRRRSARRAR